MSNTPGPWTYWNGYPDEQFFGLKPKSRLSGIMAYAGTDQEILVARIIHSKTWQTPKNPEEIAANGRLIAAAPEMLEMLHCCLNQFNPSGGETKPGSIAFDIQKLIAKAEGKK